MDRSTPCTALVVDDEPQVLNVAMRALERAGYNTLGASGPARAEAICRDHPGSIDVLVMDVVLDGSHGYDAVPNLLALRPDMQVLYISGYPGQLMFAATGVQAAFLLKPFDAEELVAAVDALLSGAKQHAA